MTAIYPTTGDVRLDGDEVPAAEGVGSVWVESLWTGWWQDAVPISRGSWIQTPFTSSQSFPTGGLTLTVARGIAVIDGYMVDFTGNTSDINHTLTDDTHNHVYLTLTYVAGLVTGYGWQIDTTPILRQNAIAIGQAIVSGGSIIKWFPSSYPEGFRFCTGLFDTGVVPKTKPVVIGYQPARIQVTGTTATLKTYGFEIDVLDVSGTYNALVFDKTQ